MSDGVPALEAVGISKSYGGVQALADVDVAIQPGEIVAVLGDNGAGKSTLIKVLAGAVAPDAGVIRVRGEVQVIANPREARALGIETVWQDLALAEDLDIAGNIYLGRELTYGRFPRLIAPMNVRKMKRQATLMLDELGVTISRSISEPVRLLSGGQAQSVAICRAAGWAREILILDEPTANLGVAQTGIVLDLCRRLRDRGAAILLVTHALQNAIGYADRIYVLRHGRNAAELCGASATLEEVVYLITGGRGQKQSEGSEE